MIVGLRVTGGLVFTLALVASLMVYPHVNKSVSASGSVRQALAKVNTWHLKGWKMQDGRQIPWEVWGRREPFFYREQVGDDIVLDDGKQRLSLYGPSKERLQKAGVSVRHPSLQDSENIPWSYSYMALQWRGERKPWKQTVKGPIFKGNDSGIEGEGVISDYFNYVDGRTWLPTRYEKWTYRHGHESQRRNVAALNSEYDIPISASASAAVLPSGYLAYDALSDPVGLPLEGSAASNGFTLNCQPLSMDKEGNILVRLRGWLGSTAVPSAWGDIHFQADSKRWASDKSMDPPVNYDDQGRAYVGVRWETLNYGNPDANSCLMLFVPREPLDAGAPQPKTLAAKFDTAVYAGWGAFGEKLLREDMTISVHLPEVGHTVANSISDYINPDWRKRVINYGGYENMETAIYKARARHYSAFRDSRNPDTPEIRRYIYWMERAIAAEVSLNVQMDRSELARTYLELGETAQERRVLLDMLRERRFLKPQALPIDRSPAGFARAEMEVMQWNEKYFLEARSILDSLDNAKHKAGRRR